MSVSINKQVYTFLNKLAKNNNREWFNEHKDEYVEAHGSMIAFADELLALMKSHDEIETPTGKKALFRIYRDVRFSKDKSPYKNHFSGSFKRASQHLRGGYYFHIAPGNSMIACGFFQPNKEDLLRIRQEIANDAEPLRAIINGKQFKETFGGLEGETLKTAPKGFDKEHPDIDLLRYKSYYVTAKFKDEEVFSTEFAQNIANKFQSLRPYLDYFSEVLTTDENGLPIV